MMQTGHIPAKDAKRWAFENVRGQWAAPLGAITDDDRIDEPGTRAGVRRLLELKIGGLAFSSLFEPWSSTHEERKVGLEIFLDEVAERLPVYVTVTDHSIKETVIIGQHALEHGAAIALVECPYEHAKTEQQVLAFFEYVCPRLDGPVGLYNTPHAGFIMSPELISRLADIENVCAIKNAINDAEHTAELYRLAGDRIVVNDPSEKHYLRSVIDHGQQTLFSTTATHLMQTPSWQPIEEYATLARAGDIAAAERVCAEIEPLRQLWESIYSVLWVREHAQHPIAYTKYWQELMGIPAGPPRPPLAPLTDRQKDEFRGRLARTGLMQRLGVDLEATSGALAR